MFRLNRVLLWEISDVIFGVKIKKGSDHVYELQ